MAINIVVPTNGSGEDDTDGTTFTTGSVSYVAGRAYLIGVWTEAGYAQDMTSVAGGTASYTYRNGYRSAGTNGMIWVGEYVPAGSHSETVTITVTVSTTRCQWCIVEITGADNAALVVYSNYEATTGNTPSVTLNAFGDATNNAAIGFFGISQATTFTHDAAGGYAELYDAQAEASQTMAVQWKTGEDRAVGGTWGASSTIWSAAAEIKIAAAAGGSAITTQLTQHYRQLRI